MAKDTAENSVYKHAFALRLRKTNFKTYLQVLLNTNRDPTDRLSEFLDSSSSETQHSGSTKRGKLSSHNSRIKNTRYVTRNNKSFMFICRPLFYFQKHRECFVLRRWLGDFYRGLCRHAAGVKQY